MRTYLNVPYSEKNEAKLFGARWDAVKRLWYANGDGAGLEKWHFTSEHQKLKTTAVYHRNKGSAKNTRKGKNRVIGLIDQAKTIDGKKYIVKRNKPTHKAHIFDGSDTLCRLLSTGGMGVVRGYEVVTELGDRELCKMCYAAWKVVNED